MFPTSSSNRLQGAAGGANDLRSTLEEGHGVAARGRTGEPQKDDLHRMGPKPAHALGLQLIAQI